LIDLAIVSAIAEFTSKGTPKNSGISAKAVPRSLSRTRTAVATITITSTTTSWIPMRICATRRDHACLTRTVASAMPSTTVTNDRSQRGQSGYAQNCVAAQAETIAVVARRNSPSTGGTC
jgi:hypothetical protein